MDDSVADLTLGEERWEEARGKISAFRAGIFDFWQKNGRKELPWRKTRDPWQILLAEVLLRKTTVRQVIVLYRGLSQLSVSQISHMSGSELEGLLQPLGMYRVRAHQLRLIAESVALADPEMLRSREFLFSLPGIGKYIVNSVACFAFAEPKPALDTNMIRVIQRVFGIRSRRSRPREDEQLWNVAESLVPQDRCREFNWGVLDFASAVCRARKPICSDCPLRKICDFLQGGG